MFCEYCGKKLEENEICECQKKEENKEIVIEELDNVTDEKIIVEYCENCGTPLAEGEICSCNNNANDNEKSEETKNEECLNNETFPLEKEEVDTKETPDISSAKKENKSLAISTEHLKKNRKPIIIALIAILIVACGVGIFLNKPVKLDLSVGFQNNITAIGCNGHASISTEIVDYSFDGGLYSRENLNYAIMDLVGTEYEINSGDYDYGTESEYITEIIDSLVFAYYVNDSKVESPTNLKNGDVLRIDVSSTLNKIDYYNLKLEDGEITITVENLVDGKPINVFDDLIVEWEGANGSGTPLISYKESSTLPNSALNLAYDVENESKLSNGDKVKVSVVHDANLEILANDGFYLETDSKEFEVTGLTNYISSKDDLTEKRLDRIKKVVKEYLKEWNSSSVTLLNTYILTPYESTKDDDLYYEKNIIKGVYSYKTDGTTYYSDWTIVDLEYDDKGTLRINGEKLSKDHVSDSGYSVDNKQPVIDEIKGNNLYMVEEV